VQIVWPGLMWLLAITAHSPYIAGDMQRTGMVIDVVDTDRFVVLVLQSVCICRRGWTMTAKQNGL